MSNCIELQGVSYSPGKDFEISGLTLTVPTGAVYGFLGPNGSGKTTTIRLMMGLHRARQGEIVVLDRTVPKDLPEILARTGYVPERPHLYPTMTVSESVRHHGAFYRRWDERWVDSLFDRFELAPDRRINRLSKGEIGKLMLLLALGQRPELLVLDEPTEGLDPVVRRELMSVLLEYVTDRHATVFISSHLIHELERFCDWIGIMDHGRLVTELPMERFKNGIKRLRVMHPELRSPGEPFEILGRSSVNGGVPGEMWLVRGWNPDMATYFEASGAQLREVVDLDLEDGFVELLRAFRSEMEGR
jgi:ABC-2 type transport system ATP-binding protein